MAAAASTGRPRVNEKFSLMLKYYEKVKYIISKLSYLDIYMIRL